MRGYLIKNNRIIEDFVYEMSINFELYNIIEKVKEITVNIFYCYCYLSPNIQVDNDNNNFKGKINDILHCEISQKTLLNIQEFLNEHFNIFIKAKNYIKSLKMDNELVDILAKDDIVGGRGESEKTIKSFGLDKLTELSIQQAKSAIDSSCYQEILFEVRKKFEGILDIIKLKSKEKIDKV